MTTVSNISQPKTMLGNYAGFISRLIAFVIDIVILSLAIVCVTWFLSITIQIFQISPIIDRLAETSPGVNQIISRQLRSLV